MDPNKFQDIIAVVCVVCVPILSPLFFAIPLHFGHSVTFPPSDPRLGYQSNPNHRGTLSIIWGCLSTVFICVYTTWHPGIPKHRKGRLVSFTKKLIWVFVGVIAPEIVLLQAADECEHARHITQKMGEDPRTPHRASASSTTDSERLLLHSLGESELLPTTTPRVDHESSPPETDKPRQEWKTTHSFFAIMGGFEDQSGSPMKPEHLIWLRTSQHSAYGEIVSQLDAIRREINDKSKADPLVKTLALAQITWFLVNIIARLASKSPICHLEWTTCGYIVCALGTYLLWWNKPYNVSERITLPVSSISQLGNIPFGRYRATYGSWTNLFLALTETLLFGAFHIAAWNIEFVNTHGQLLWRICSILVTVLPILSVFTMLADKVLGEIWSSILGALCMTSYAIARVVLLCLLVLSFWSLPAGVYNDTNWSSFFPSLS